MNDDASINRTCKMIKKTRIFSAALVFVVVHLFGPLPVSWAQSPQKPLGEPVEQLQKKPAAATEPVISPSRLKELNDRALLTPTKTPIGESLTVPMGLTVPGVPFETRQIGFRTDNDVILHIFAADTAGSGKILLMSNTEGVTMLWVCDMSGTLLKAGRYERRQTTDIPRDQARPSFEAELRLWAEANLEPPSPPAQG